MLALLRWGSKVSQMQLANALCAYREMAVEVDAGRV